MGIQKVTVRLVDIVDPNKEIKRRNFQLVDGRLRVPQVLDYFHVKSMEWKEEDVILAVRDDGLSDLKFEGGEVISITTDTSGPDGADPSDTSLRSSVSTSASESGSEREDEVMTNDLMSSSSSSSSSSGSTTPPTLMPRGRAMTLPIAEPPQVVQVVRHTSTFSESPALAEVSLASSKSADLHRSVGWKHSSPSPLGIASKVAGEHFRGRRDSSVLTEPIKLFEPMSSIRQPDSAMDFCFKLIVVGEGNCGKTSLIRRYVHGKYSRHYKATIGVDFCAKEFIVSSRFNVRLQLWDVAGQERFGNFTRVYFKEAVGGAVVFDLTSPKTLASAVKWKQDIDDKVRLENGLPIPVVLIGNKTDLVKDLDTQFTPEFLDQFCLENKFSAWFTTSCLLNHNVSKAFQYLGNVVLENDMKYPCLKEEDKKAIKLNFSSTRQIGSPVLGSGKEKSCCST